MEYNTFSIAGYGLFDEDGNKITKITNHGRIKQLILKGEDAIRCYFEDMLKMTNLKTLELCGRAPENFKFSTIAHLTKLKKISFEHTTIESFDGLEKLTNLEYLFVSGTIYSNISLKPIIQLTKRNQLRFLYLSRHYKEDEEINYYRFRNLYDMGYLFDLYKRRINKGLNILRLQLLEDRLRSLWFTFFYQRRDQKGYNRFSYISISEMK